MSDNFQSPNNQLSRQVGDGRGFGNGLFDIRIWTVKDVAKYLDVTPGHVYNMVSRREIPFKKRKRRGRLYFIPQEIYDWVFEEGFYDS